MRVLYIDGDGPFGGASRSLYEVVRALPKGSVDVYFVATQGTALNFYKQLAKDVVVVRGLTKIDNTRYSYYRGVRWLILLRELFHLPFTFIALARAKRRWKSVDLIHANELAYLVPGLIAKWLFGAPLVFHLRSLMRRENRSFRQRWLTKVMRSASAVIAIDQNVRATVPMDLDIDVIHNSFTAKRVIATHDGIQKKLDSLRRTSLKVGFVGNLHRSKGLFELLDAAKLVRDANGDVEFVIVGGTTRNDKGLRARILEYTGLAQNIEGDLRRRIEKERLEDTFHMFGPTIDIQSVYEGIDVLAFPSHLDAPGRPVFEAAFSGVPSIVAVENPNSDTLVPGETGLAIPVPDSNDLAQAILYFANNREEVRRMGANAKKLAEQNFNPESNARTLLAVYSRIVGKAA